MSNLHNSAQHKWNTCGRCVYCN